jgi:hypothetical protein
MRIQEKMVLKEQRQKNSKYTEVMLLFAPQSSDRLISVHRCI